MLNEEVSFIFLYVAAFGFSDYIVNYLNLEGIYYLLYYFIILCMGIYGVYIYKLT